MQFEILAIFRSLNDFRRQNLDWDFEGRNSGEFHSRQGYYNPDRAGPSRILHSGEVRSSSDYGHHSSDHSSSYGSSSSGYGHSGGGGHSGGHRYNMLTLLIMSH